MPPAARMSGDLRLALRQLLLAPGFSAICILALGLGIGAASTTFTAFHATLLRPMPLVRDPDRLVAVVMHPAAQPGDDMGLSLPDYLELDRTLTRVEGVAVHQARTFILTGRTGPVRAGGSAISARTFGILGVPPALGRDFRPDEDDPASPLPVLLSHTLWLDLYGGDTNVIGSTVGVNGQPAIVAGVMPPGWNYPDRSEIWMPLRISPGQAERGQHFLQGVARIRDGSSFEQADAEARATGARFSRENPEFNDGIGIRLAPLRSWVARDSAQLLRLLLGSVLCVQFMACANVAGLVLARGTSRARDIAVRRALGATPFRIARGLFLEVAVLGVAGTLLGLLFAAWGAHLVRIALPDRAPFWLDVTPGAPVIGFAAALGFASVVLAGLVPAINLARQDLGWEIRLQGRGNIGYPGHARIRNALVVTEIALALVLLAGAGLMARSYRNATRAHPGFDPAHILTFRAGLPPTTHTNAADYHRFFNTVGAELRALPGVTDAGAISQLPASGSETVAALEFEGRRSASLMDAPFANARSVTPGALEALRTRLHQGRLIDERDIPDSMPVAIVDATFARTFFPDGNALLQRFRSYQPTGTPESSAWYTIVGVIDDMSEHFDARPHVPTFLLAHAQSPIPFLSMVVRVAPGARLSHRDLQAAVFRANPDIPVYNVEPLEQVLRRTHWHKRFFGGLFSIMAGLALFLAALGIYGVMSHAVAGRTREIGVHIALGASRREIIRLTLRNALGLVSVGLALGLAAAAALARLLSGHLFGVQPHDAATFVGVALLLALVALAACAVPVRRALRIDPMAAVRGG